jgi:SAM-dependent methyltransferase
VLDIASGSGIAAEAALNAVGLSGHVVAADIEPPMLEEARKRLGGFSNISFAHEDGQALTFPDASFDAILCCMALMIFPGRARAAFQDKTTAPNQLGHPRRCRAFVSKASVYRLLKAHDLIASPAFIVIKAADGAGRPS